MPDISQLTDDDLHKALGYKAGSDITKISDDDLMKSIHPADDSADMKDAQWGVAHPNLRALQTTASQSFVNPIYQAAKGIAPAVKGIEKGIGYNPPDSMMPSRGNFAPPDMSNAPMAARFLGDVANGGAQGAAATMAGGGNLIMGYGALSALGAYGRGDNPIPAAISGAASAIPQMIAGKAGSSIASAAAKPFGGMIAKYAPNVGTSVGMGGASAGQAAMTGGNPVEAGASGAAFGLMSPMNPIGTKSNPTMVSPEEHGAMVDEGAKIYRNVLNPGKGIINKIEVKSGGDVDNAMRLAAKEGIVINSKEGKLDTRGAVDQLKTKVAPMYDEQNQILASNPEKQFDLQDIGDQVKNNLRAKLGTSNVPTAEDLENYVGNKVKKGRVQDLIDAEINLHGNNVDGQTLNMIKQGMWSKSYNPLEPNENAMHRAIGFSAKDAIEKAYPMDSIKENNAKIGQYLQLQHILEQTHGQIVQGGKIGKYLAKGAGAVVGGVVGSHVPVLGEVVGPIAGMEVGGRINDFMNDPSRITGNWANKINSVKINNPQPINITRPGVVIPQVMPKGGSQNPIAGNLPSPQQKLPTPSTTYGPGFTMKSPEPGTQEHAQTFPQSNVNPLRYAQQGQGQQIVPQFKNTEEAANFGSANRDNPNIVSNLKMMLDEGLKQSNAIKSLGEKATDAQLAQGMKIATQNQFYREAYEAATKTGGFKDWGSKALATAGILGAASVFHPSNSQAQTVKYPDRLKLNANQYIMKNEGFGKNGRDGWPYLDSRGIKTVGYGFNMSGPAAKYIPDAVKQGRRPLSKQEGDSIFNKIYPDVVASAHKFAGDAWDNLSVNQQKSLIDMSWNMGSKLNGFKNLRAALQGGNYNTAAREIMNSDYARKDAPQRALQNSVLMQQ